MSARSAARRRLPAGAIVLDTAFLVVAMALAAASFWPVHRTSALVVAVAAALAAGGAVALLGAAFRWPAWAVGLATIVAYLLLGVPVAVPDQALGGVAPTVPGLTELVSAAALSWKELLTISLPVGSYQELLVPVFLLTLVLTVVALSVARRTRHGELAVLAPIALFLGGVLLGPDEESLPVPLALALLVPLLLFLLWRRQRRRTQALRLLNEQAGMRVEARADRRVAGARTAAGAAVILALAAGGAVAASAVVPVSAPRTVLRSAIEIPFDPQDYPSPLSGFRRFFSPEVAGSTLLTVSGLEKGERMRLATLDTYDGVVFTVGSAAVTSASGAFARVPSTIDQSGVDGRDASLEVTIAGYRGVWLPDAGLLRSVDFRGPGAAALRNAFYYNGASGTGAVLGGLSEGDEYVLDAVLPPEVDAQALDGLEPGSSPVPALAVVPGELDATIAEYTDASDSPGRRLAAAIAGLRHDGYVSHGGDGEPFSASGHSAARITDLLTARPMLGDAEQYATTAALMARRLGFPSRVVLGFVAPHGGTAVPLTGADVSAWIEVDTAESGWVPVDPNPEVRDIPERQPDQSTSVSRPQSVVQPPPDEELQQDEQVPPDVSEEAQQPQPPAWLAVVLTVLRVLGWLAVAGAILLAPFLAVLGAKWTRRRRRMRARDPLARIRGGWDEFADAALDAGVEVQPSSTRNELAIAVGGRKPLVLASVVDRAIFSPVDPAQLDADRVWAAVSDLRSDLGQGRTRWERLKALVSLRSLRRSSKRKDNG
jgi:hypothetical protein